MRLIDADNLNFTFDRCCFSEEDEQYVQGVDDAIGVVNNAPTIDAVPVVRCRECIHRDGTPGQPNILCGQMHDDDFCSYGQRKEYRDEVSKS